MKRILGFLAVLSTALLLSGASGASAAPKTVTISGKAFIFSHMDTYISGATIKVREFPKISATTDSLGDYVLTVPNDSNVTPYIVSGEGLLTKHAKSDDAPTGTVQTHWNEIDLQTFHPRGEDIENANFQTPQDAEYNALKALLQIESNPETGRPAQCAIVTTASQRDVRDTTYKGYWENTPHGVPGATSIEYPALDGPIYFNEHVIPDKTATASSGDGGIIWPVVPTGSYRIITSSPSDRLASFLATCAPGRVINANPPWGAYQLVDGEKPLAASNVAASVTSVKASRKSKTKRVLTVKLKSGEAIAATITVKAGSKQIKGTPKLVPGTKKLTFAFGAKIKARQAKVRVKLADASGVSFTTVKKVNVPKVIKKKNRKAKQKAGKRK
jgi:hypothetical protein